MKAIITALMFHVFHHQHTNRQANGQSDNIDKGIKSILKQVAPGGLEIVLKHGRRFGLQ
jgi:hypothetical protein